MTSDSERAVDRVFADIAARPYPEVSVVAHADAVGNTQFNDPLSRQRAHRVRYRLVARAMSADRIEVSRRGKRELLVRTTDGVSEPRNRRVETSVR